MSVILERWQAGVLAGSVLVAGVAVAGGAFLGGYALGDQPTPPPPTELADKTYTVEDLEAALASCEIEEAVVDGGAVTLLGGDHSPMKRQCFVGEMGASELAIAEYGYSSSGTPQEYYLDSGDYSWSNVRMTWEQTNQGRDVTISVG